MLNEGNYAIEGMQEETRPEKLYRRAIMYYGNQCACCKATKRLTIDHIKAEGGRHRNFLKKNPWAIYEWLWNHKYPAGFQVLCYDCNEAKWDGPYCPLHWSKIPAQRQYVEESLLNVLAALGGEKRCVPAKELFGYLRDGPSRVRYNIRKVLRELEKKKLISHRKNPNLYWMEPDGREKIRLFS